MGILCLKHVIINGLCRTRNFRLLFFFCGSDVVDVLFEDGPDDEWERREDKVVHGDVDVVEDGLSGISAEEGEDKLGNGEEHVFVEKVENHLSNTHVVPPAVHQQQSP